MTLWIPVTLAAAFFQTLRFMLQRQLALSTLSAGGATFARFVYSAPLVLLLAAIYLETTGQALPALPAQFWMYGAIGGFAQVTATICVVLLFKARNFAVGITFKKTEVIQAVVFGFLVLNDSVSLAGLLAICFGLVGVLLLSRAPDQDGFELRRLFNRAALLGLASGMLFAVSAVCYRGASLSLEMSDPIARAAITLGSVTTLQMIGMAIWLRFREAGQLAAVWQARRVAVFVGLMSMAGSFCWFLAFTLQNAAYVKAVGQIELLLSALVSVLIFGERIALREWAGMGFLLISVTALVLVA